MEQFVEIKAIRKVDYKKICLIRLKLILTVLILGPYQVPTYKRQFSKQLP